MQSTFSYKQLGKQMRQIYTQTQMDIKNNSKLTLNITKEIQNLEKKFLLLQDHQNQSFKNKQQFKKNNYSSHMNQQKLQIEKQHSHFLQQSLYKEKQKQNNLQPYSNKKKSFNLSLKKDYSKHMKSMRSLDQQKKRIYNDTEQFVINKNKINIENQSTEPYYKSPSQSPGFKYKIKHNIEFSNDQDKLEWIGQNVIGLTTTYTSPFHFQLQTVYVDHTATNRPFKVVQSMVDYVKLFAANPHTQFSEFGKFSTELVHYSHQSLLRSFSASPEDYIVIPAGSGSTGAINHAIQVLTSKNYFQKHKDTTVFISPYEHHSNILPWVEIFGKVELLFHDSESFLKFSSIKQQLSKHPSNSMIVSVSATSNVTSKLTDLPRLNAIIKQLRKSTAKKIIFAIDCAAYCCHHQLNIKELDEVDFAFISPHKNLGGVETCGLLLMRKSLAQNKPSFPGGGTVIFVGGYHREAVLYDKNPFSRQVAGTPPYVGFYRSALSFQLLKNVIGYNFITAKQFKSTKYFFKQIKKMNSRLNSKGYSCYIKTYRSQSFYNYANIIPFNIVCQNQEIAYINFISSALTDIFGIQLRSGCFCAGPYGMELLQMTQQYIQTVSQKVFNGIGRLKPGFLRMDLTFYLKQFQLKYLAKALYYVCKYHKNLEKLYIIQDSGKVIARNRFATVKDYLFGFNHSNEAIRNTHQQNYEEKSRLQDRQHTLQRQLRNGKAVCKHPESYI